ncbi:MAG: peroxiredoxin [Bacteroidetes bacterium GWF2_38_335]|nr:MAG: peroxiredoxin [Bacteroidetes bacterium GWF2_38_335]OFY77448.1 MAG: peroxiredoxin [Bacteroidetes bacterium RIFOXYA12_FULL_38_20]HBS87263.1 thioredoxin-dependent thiol peroxidase [Bacteroidales bacterium]
MAQLKEGDKAPVFSGINQDGKQIGLKDFSGKKLVLYFYPKDSTPGCTAEACNLRDNFSFLRKKGFEILGVSADSEKSHVNFRSKNNLPFDLISDVDRIMLKEYGAWGEKKLYGKVYEGILRKTFVISEKGLIEKIIEKVDTKDHTNQILNLYK